ncbi:outer membrane protein assembly factor BamA [Rhodobacterales bacterium 52_120_T64]|nr:outer membrane protein assembly factor BamA [Rhodobacterales bacterium 52_120_T64]
MNCVLLEKLSVKSCITSVFLSLPIATPLLTATMLATPAYSAVISSISVSGNELIPSQTIRDFAGIKFGTNLTPADINDVLRRLYDSGMFENVELRVAGSNLVITVVENPTISVIAFEGNTNLKDAELAAVIKSSIRSPFNRLTAQADAQTIAHMYNLEGRVDVSVNPVIIPVSEGRVNLVFEVTESDVAGVNRISFVGNSAFSDRKLRGVIETNETNVLSFVLRGNTVNADTIALDRQKLTNYYANKGYIDFEVLSSIAELSADRSGHFLTHTVNEGFKYTFGEGTISSSINGVGTEAFEKIVNIRSGRPYSIEDVNEIVEAIEIEAVKQGLPFLRVNPNHTKNGADRTVDVNFEIVAGRRVYVERIDIGGNTGTVERVIRRQFDFVEGDAFNARKMADARDNLMSLGIFGNTNVSVRDGSSPDKVIVDVDVQDVPTGSVGFALGYSSDSGFNGLISLTEDNFLGRGQDFALELSYGEDTQVFSLSFNEPAFLDRDLSAGFSLYFQKSDFDASSFQTTNLGFEPSVRFAVGEDTSMKLSYSLSRDEIRDVHDDASAIIFADAVGPQITSSFGVTLSYDRRNSRVNPTSGYFLTLEEDFAGLGGDLNFSKTIVRAKAYTAFFDENVVVSAEVEGGALVTTDGSNTRVTDRFFLGGNSLKGFATGGIGPRDTSTANDDALGGNYYGVVRLQGTFPIGLGEDAGIYGGVFAEAGSVWDLGDIGFADDEMSIRASSGFSLFWSSPLGPLEFSYAVPILYEDDDVTQNFSVAISTRF